MLIPASTACWTNGILTLDQRRRRCSLVKPPLVHNSPFFGDVTNAKTDRLWYMNTNSTVIYFGIKDSEMTNKSVHVNTESWSLEVKDVNDLTLRGCQRFYGPRVAAVKDDMKAASTLQTVLNFFSVEYSIPCYLESSWCYQTHHSILVNSNLLD